MDNNCGMVDCNGSHIANSWNTVVDDSTEVERMVNDIHRHIDTRWMRPISNRHCPMALWVR